MRSSLRVPWIVAAIGLASSLPCRAQCLDWDDRFYAPGTNDVVRAMTSFDDGSGAAVYMGGDFTAVGKGPANSIVKWDGSEWSPLAGGLDNDVNALAVFDDGSGPALFVGGTFTHADGRAANRIAKWDGASWSTLGTGMNQTVNALCVFDDGSGPALYAGGAFTDAGGVPASFIAKWNGASWSALGTGVNQTVYALYSFDDGSGAALYAGGLMTTAGGMSANRIARWNGSSWSNVGGGMNSSVRALTAFDDGSGPALHAGGSFTLADGSTANHVAKWNGTSWSDLPGSPTNLQVNALSAFDGGSGSELFVGGQLNGAEPATALGVIQKWNGAAWATVSSGANIGLPTAGVQSLFAFDLGAGPRLFVGGGFLGAGDSAAKNVAQWDGATWSSVGNGQGVVDATGVFTIVDAFTIFDDGSGPALFAGGSFRAAGSALANRIAKWNGTGWSALGAGVAHGIGGGPATVYALAVFDEGSGPTLFAGGDFQDAGSEIFIGRIARWNGTTWSSVANGTGPNGIIRTLTTFDDGSGTALFAGGQFNFGGNNKIAKWNGSAWSALGSGANQTVYSMCVFDDGTGPALFAGGVFTSMGGVPVHGLAKWNGTSWSDVGGGVGGGSPPSVYALHVYNDGSGPVLVVGGNFTSAGGVSASRIARWNGTTWSPFSSGMIDAIVSLTAVRALATFDDGTGSTLYAGGSFTNAGGVDAKNIAKWSGSGWEALDGGVGGISTSAPLSALAVYDDGVDGVPDLYLGGQFAIAGSTQSSSIAQWRGCAPGTSYCFGDGLDPLVTAQCPCANFGDPGHGCANSNAALGGARLHASGNKLPNTVLLTCEGIPNNNLCTFLRGSLNTPAGAVFGDGINCASGTIIRFGQQMSGQGGNVSNTVAVAPLTVPPGNTRYYQVQYRNPAPAFCAPATFNISNGYRIDW